MKVHTRETNLTNFRFPEENKSKGKNQRKTSNVGGRRETGISLRGKPRKTRVSDWKEVAFPTEINHITTNPNHRFLCASTNKGFLIFCLKSFKVLLERHRDEPLIECHMLNMTNLLFYRTKQNPNAICVYDDSKQAEVDQISSEQKIVSFQLNLRFMYMKTLEPRSKSIRVNVYDMANFKEKLYGVELNDCVQNPELIICHNFPTTFYWSQKQKGIIKSLDVEQNPGKEKKLHSKFIPKFRISQSNKYMVTSSNNGTTFRVFLLSSYEKQFEFRWGSRFKSQVVLSMDISLDDSMFMAVLEDGWVLVSSIDCLQKIEFETRIENAQVIFLNHHDLIAVYDQKLKLYLYQIDMEKKTHQLIFENDFNKE